MIKLRTDFMPIFSNDGTTEKDIVDNKWSNFKIKRDISYYKLTEKDKQRPDLISQSVYGVADYWWIICKFNQIDDVFNDIIPGTMIKIPNIEDVAEWINNS